MKFKEIAIIVVTGVALVVVLWLGNRFRRFVAAKITNNWQITEWQFWFASISTKEQAIVIIRRASLDFIVLLGFELVVVACLALVTLTAGALTANVWFVTFLPSAVFVALWIGLAVWVGKKSYPAALIFAVLMTLPTIAVIWKISSANIASSAFPLCFCLAMNWMAWRAFTAIRKFRTFP